jgi:predicted phage tail component-like protein
LRFNGLSKPYLKVLKGRKRPTWASLKRNILTVDGLPGGYLQDTTTDIRTIDVPVLIEAEDIADLQKVKEDLAAWLITDQPQELIFDDEPDRIYYAIVDGSLDISELARSGQGTITFICPDPYKYSSLENVNNFTNTGVVNVAGTATAEPNIKVTVSKDTTFVAIGNGEQINMVGMPAEVTQQQTQQTERVFWDDMGSLNNWANTSYVEGGTNTGTMKTTGYSFYTDSYGSGSGWHGPALKKSIGQTVQDFQVDALVILNGSNGQVGCVEIDFLDSNDNFVGKMYLIKRAANNKANWAVFRAGTASNGHEIMNQRGAYDSTWANFNGMLRLSRVGNVWSVYVAQIDSKGNHNSRAGATWTDTYNISTNPIAKIQVQLWQYGTTPAPSQYISDVKVYKINSLSDTQVPIIASAGDIIEFDHQNDIIRKNGEDITKYKALIGEYFSLKPGVNTIDVEPADSVSATEVRWRDRWL